MPLEDLQVDAARRPPDWRWQKACLTHYDKRLGLDRTRDDPGVAAAYEFQKALDAGPTDRFELLELQDRYPGIRPAYNLRFHPELLAPTGETRGTLCEYQDIAYEVEARILAGQSYEAIAARFGLTVKALRWYQALFFNVRDRLEQRSYIAHNVIGPALYDRSLDRDRGALWKFIARCCGVGGVDVHAEVLRTEKIEGHDQYDDFARRGARSLTGRLAMLASMSVRGKDDYTKLQLMEVYTHFREVEDLADGGGDRSATGALLDKFLGTVTWARVTMTAEGVAPRRQAGLRASELMALHVGAEQPHLALLEDLRYPVKGAGPEPPVGE